jgi:hypothetical protein
METNVVDIELTASGATSHAPATTVAATSESASAGSVATPTLVEWRARAGAGTGATRSDKSGLGLAVLANCERLVLPAKTGGKGRVLSQAYLANIDESSHEVSVAKRIDRMLSLLSRRVFHDTRQRSLLVPAQNPHVDRTGRHRLTRNPIPKTVTNPSRQSNSSTKV